MLLPVFLKYSTMRLFLVIFQQCYKARALPIFFHLQRNNSLAEFDHLKEALNGFLAVEKSS